ncbi:receptor-like protein 12 [Pyrus ussuriensis x Pyrus communis]|uniref:Receptor-like protein 12 n=1 Tax=Pyrus ussuriensis x Pyrus communis TaxID=2448454 RepID=A0A5N5I6F0_9ROSA|nr:receptor-like protein 12 [Pyrus ussuriensis x Pyrus communis]
MEKISQETRGEVSRRCSITGSLQRRLDLEYSTLENRTREMMRDVSAVMELVILLFPILKENGNKGKSKEKSRTNRPLDWIKDLIVKGKLLLEKPKANMMIDTDPFPEVSINMINLTWAEKGKDRVFWEVKVERRQVDRPIEGAMKLPENPKAAIIKELEVPATGAIIDQKLIKRRNKEKQEAHKNVMRAAERETSRNAFQWLRRNSQPKSLLEVFKNYEASEEVDDREAKVPRWVDVKPP